MAFTLKIKSSSVAGKVPDASALAVAELGLNLVDQKLYSKDANGTVFEIGQAGDIPNGPTPPSNGNQLGDLFFDSFNNILLYWNGTEWVPVGSEAIALNDLTDVDTSGVTDGMVLAYNGASWVPYDPETFNPQAGRALTYDNNTDPSTLNADIATETTVGVVSVGDGLEVSLLGELSVTPVDIPPGTIVSETPPNNPATGQLWWDSTGDGGPLYIWDGSEWAVTAPDSSFDKTEADALYLSKTNDDTAAGEITFAAGLEATAGEIRSTSTEERPFRSTATGTKVEHFGFWADADNATVTDAAFGFYASNTLTSISGNPTEIVGFDSNLTEGPNVYNFYAGGSAENYFEGLSTFNNGIQITGGNGIQISGETTHWNCINNNPALNRGNSDTVHGIVSNLESNANNNDYNAFYVPLSVTANKGNDSVMVCGFNSAVESGTNHYGFYSGGTAENFFRGRTRIKGGSTMDQGWIDIGNKSNSPYLEIRRQGSTQSGINAFEITATANNPQTVYSINYAGQTSAVFSLNTVGAAAITDASTTIKAFTPTAAGFSGQDFVDHLPDAVDMSTLTADGVMVSESKLLPVVVKALQEALERIEQLEAAATNPPAY